MSGITTVTANPAVNTFPGGLTVPAGNGLNCSQAAALLAVKWGVGVSAYGFVGADDLSTFLAVGSAQIDLRLTAIPGRTRVISYVDTQADDVEPATSGPGSYEVRPSDLVLLKDNVRRVLPGEWVVLTGSLPLGISPSFYAEMIELLREREAKIVLDTRAAELETALLLAPPDVIKPNRTELRQLVGGQPIDTDPWLLKHAETLFPDGLAIFSLGPDGIFARDGVTGKAWHLRCPRSTNLPVLNTVGCGDSLVAWFTVARSAGYGTLLALMHGIAASTANVTSPVPGVFDPQLAFELMDGIQVIQVA